MPEETAKAWAAEDIFAMWCSVGGECGAGGAGTAGRTEMGAGRVSAAGVVVLAADALEGGRLVYRHGRGAVLVLVLRILHRRTQRGEAVRPAGPVGRVGLRRGELSRTGDVERL
jgi:hypothetical protein